MSLLSAGSISLDSTFNQLYTILILGYSLSIQRLLPSGVCCTMVPAMLMLAVSYQLTVLSVNTLPHPWYSLRPTNETLLVPSAPS
jgi:hypothetical protein